MPNIKFTDYVPTSLVGVNSASPSLAAEVVTGLPLPTGARPGTCFYLSESQANQLSAIAINGATVMQCHAGWYKVVQVAPTATAGLIAQGLIGSQAVLGVDSQVTDVVHGAAALGTGQNSVIFLNSVTPGNYTIVQVAGDCNVYSSAAVATVGTLLVYSATTGQVAPASGSPTFAQLSTIVGLAEQVTAGAGLVRANVNFPFSQF